MSIDSGMKAVIHNRKHNFFDRFNEFMEDDEYYFTRRPDPSFDFIEKYDEDGNPVYSDPDKAKIYNARIARFKATKIVLDCNLNIYYTDDESSDFFGYSYDEIIGMHNDGVVIPEEILSWAYAMAEANTLEMTSETEGGSNDAQELYIELKNNPFLNIKTITKVFVNKCEEQTDELEAYLDEIDPIEKEMKNAKASAEKEKQNSLDNIKSITSEWKELQTKVKSGQELSDSEQERLDEIQNLFADEDNEYQNKVDNITKNFTKIGEKLSIITGKADTAFDFGEQTIVVAKELAEYENTHKKKNLFGNLIGGSISGILGVLSLTGNKKFSETAHTIGVDTEYFAKDINTTIQEVQLLMQETADTAGFSLEDSSYTAAPLTTDELTLEPITTTTTSSNGASDPEPEPPVVTPNGDTETPEPPVEGGEPTDGGETDGVDGTDETPDNEDNGKTDEELTEEGKKTLEDVDAKKLDPISLQRLIKAEGEDSEKKGKDATELVEKLRVQSAIVDDKETKVEEKRTEAQEASEADTAEGTNNEDDLGDVQVEVEESQTDLDAATEDEALTVEGLRETFKGYKAANKKYTKDVNYSNEVMTGTMLFGNGVIIGGGTLSSIGIANIVTGNSLIAAGWWNPATLALGMYLIGLGVNETTIGAALIANGTALTLLAETGFEINEETGEKINVSGEDIATANESLDEIERQQMEELGLEAPEKSEDEEDDDEIEKTGIEKDKDILANMQEGNKILPELRSQSISEGQKSSDLGEENVTELTKLERQTPELIETTIAFEQTKQQKEAMSMTSQDDAEITEAQDPKEIYDEYRNDFNADLDTNNEFKQDIRTTDEQAKMNLDLAILGNKNGAARTTLGTSEVAAGTILIAQFWNPIAVKLGLELIKRGTADIALGSEMMAVGLALTVNSTTTLLADEIASNKIAESDKKTNDSLDRVDQIEAEINAAVQEQLAATGEKDLNGMSTIELLTLIIMNGINASTLGIENSELIEALKEKLPELLEEAKANAATENAKNTEIIEETETPENDNEDNNDEDGDKSIFAQYKNDFNTDLSTNEKYSSEIKQAEGMSQIIRSSFFLGAPVKKASNRINESNEQTSQALDEVAEMEQQVEEAKKAAQAEQEAQTTEATAAAANAPKEDIDPKDAVSNAADVEKDAADAVEDDADEVEKNEKAEKKEEKNEKKIAKKEKKQTKSLKKGQKTVEKKEKEAQENEKEATEQIASGEETVANSGQDDAQSSGDQTTEELSEAESISGEVEEIVAEAQTAVTEATSAIQAATNENQAIVGEMNTINSSLQQDQAKLTNLGNQLKQKEKQASSAAPAQAPQQPAQAPAEEPQTPQPAPKKTNAAKKPQQPEKPEQPEQPNVQQPVQAPQKPKPVDAEPTVQDAPAGSDKIQFASDNEKQPELVGFVAQSDSLASGSVLASSAPKKTTTTSSTNNVNPAQKKTTQNKQATNKKQNNNTQNANNNEEQQALPQPKAAKRTTPKAFDINTMTGGGAGNGGNDETKGIRVSMQAVRAAAFNKQARLTNMQIRANNNVMANIQKEAQAQAAAARQERLAREKQERIAKIKEFAGYAQLAGGLTTTAGMIVEKVGIVTQNTGTAQVTNGTAVVAQGVSNLSLATGLITTGTSTITIGTTQIAIGVTELGVGTVAVTTGTAAEAAGTATETTGTVLVASGTPLLSNPFTAAAGAALVASGTTTIISGTATMGSGAALISSGAVEITTGAATEATGAGTVVTGTATLTTATMDAAQATASITSGTALIATGSATIASGTGLIATGGVIQAVGTYVTAAAAATSSAADMANGNILGGLATIVGAAASVVGVSAPVSQLGNAAMQVGSQGVALAGQLTTNNAGQNNNQQQNQKKKKAFKQNPNTQKIVDKTQKRAQAVSNRFNK